MIKGIPATTTPVSIMLQIAEKVKERRLELNLTQSALAKRSDMSLSSYRRFETTGEISLKMNDVKIIAVKLSGESIGKLALSSDNLCAFNIL